MKKTKIIVLIILSVSVVILIVGLKMYHKPHKNIEETEATVIATSDIVLNDFETNETLANTKYLEQIVEVTGTILEKSEHKNKGIVTLSAQAAIGNVMCYLSETENQKFATLQEGSKVTIKGVCTGYLMDVVLVRCVINN
ncbi:OB-fold protein [Wenyingzhuangia sp. IMCC45533]